MARPPKNSCDYFPHDAGMRNHKKVRAIRSKFGIMGYAVWVMTLEHLTGSDGNVFPYSDLEFELMSGDFGISATEIRDVIDYCISLELLFNKNGFINSDSLDERLAPVYQKRGLAKEQSASQKRINGKFATVTPVDPVVSVTEMPQSKVNESKEEETKVKKRKVSGAADAATQAIELREKDFMNRVAKHLDKYNQQMLRDFFDYWTEKNEGGAKMRFEMQKVFDINKRLATWSRNEKKTNNGIHKRNGLTAQGTIDRINSYT